MKRKSIDIAVFVAAGIIALAGVLYISFKPKTLTIIHVNDTHSQIEPIRSGEYAGMGGMLERAAYVDSVRAAVGAENLLLMHAGDFSQDTSYFSTLGGDLEIETINAFGYDVVTLGNHEFDNGPEDLARRLKKLNCPVVCANYDFSPFELGSIVKPYVILQKAGLKIGVFGMLTNILKVVDRSVADRLPKLDDVPTAQKWADYLKNEEKCDLVIALTHIGIPEDEGQFIDPVMVSSTRNIDLVVGGHSHTFLDGILYVKNLDGKEIPIVQNGCWGLNAGKIDIIK